MWSKASGEGKNMILLKIHDDSVVSLCDSDLIGKTFEHGDMQLTVSERFYLGEEASEEEIKAALTNAKTVNIVGKGSISMALKLGAITKDTVKDIGGVPHAQVFSLIS